MSRLSAFNLQNWIQEHEHLLKPPVGNQQIWQDTDMMVTIVGGPNCRTDYHDDPVEEFFYQLKGGMLLKVCDNGDFYDIPIREGEVFFLPGHVRHSPQRPQEGSIGLVVEPKRDTGDLDGFEWFCFDCNHLIHRAEVQLQSIVKDLPELFKNFYGDTSLHECQNCGATHPGKEPPAGWVQL